MSDESINQQQDSHSENQQQNVSKGQHVLPGSLEATILARLGLLQRTDLVAEQDMPTWQKHVLNIQESTEQLLSVENHSRKIRESIETIDRALRKSEHEAIRMAAVRSLGKLYLARRGLVSREPFLYALEDPHPEVQVTAIEALISFIKTSGYDHLSSEMYILL